MKKLSYILFVLFILGNLAACQKKQFALTGKENSEEAFSKCLELSTKKKFQEAIDCLEIFKSRFPTSRSSLEAEIRIADAYFAKKEYLLAAETYQLFTKLHPTSDKLDYVYYRIGLCYLNKTPKAVDRDQGNLPSATDSFAIVFQQFPDSQYAKIARFKYDEARRLEARRHFYVGRFYYRWGEYKAAIPRFQEVYEKYPHLGLDEDALFYTALAYHKLGKNEAARQVAEIMKTEFPNSSKTKKVSNKVK
jgi:outer membrane protein assembly factor BamD